MQAKLIYALSGALLFTGCSDVSRERLDGETLVMTQDVDLDGNYMDEDAKRINMRRDNIALRLVRFEDVRDAESRSRLLEESVVYEYTPSKLVGGTDKYFPRMFKRYMINQKDKNAFRVEVELTHLKTYISVGDFLAGQFGRYRVEMKANVLVRDKGSKVLLKEAYTVRKDEVRKPYKGDTPPAAYDKKQMLKVLQDATKSLVTEASWSMYKKLKRHQKQNKYDSPIYNG